VHKFQDCLFSLSQLPTKPNLT